MASSDTVKTESNDKTDVMYVQYNGIGFNITFCKICIRVRVMERK